MFIKKSQKVVALYIRKDLMISANRTSYYFSNFITYEQNFKSFCSVATKLLFGTAIFSKIDSHFLVSLDVVFRK